MNKVIIFMLLSISFAYNALGQVLPINPKLINVTKESVSPIPQEKKAVPYTTEKKKLDSSINAPEPLITADKPKVGNKIIKENNIKPNKD